MYGASYILYVAANTCMVRAVLYCTVLRAFSHFHAIYRCFPYNSARNSYFPLHLCAGPVGDSGAQINQPTGARVQTSTSVGALAVPVQYAQRLADRTFGALARANCRSDIPNKSSKHKIFHYFMHMRAKTTCGFLICHSDVILNTVSTVYLVPT